MKLSFHTAYVARFLLLYGLSFLTLKAQGQGSFNPGSRATTSIYVSKQGNAVGNGTNGSYSKATDNYEQGTVTLTKTGPITYNINPAGLAISTNESKSWAGNIKGDPAAIPPAGTSVPAMLKGDYTIQYSRPQGSDINGTVLSTHTCSGCPAHGPGVHGTHEIVKKTGADSLQFDVVSIKLQLNGPAMACAGDTLTYTATTYPSTGGTITWSTGETGRSIRVPATANTTIKATLAIAGVSYTDSLNLQVTALRAWRVTPAFPPAFVGWQRQLRQVDEIKRQTKLVLEAVPARVTVKGPDVNFTFGERDCCKDGVVTVNGEHKASIVITGGIYGKVPIGVPPYTARFSLRKYMYGFIFLVDCEYGTFLEVGAEGRGELGYRANECTGEDCMTGSIGINFPLKLSFTASGSICIQRRNTPARPCLGITQSGRRCGRSTNNSCGYCSNYNGGAPLHTTQSWWCFSCPSFSVTPLAVTTNLYGRVTYNERNCTEGLGFYAGIGPVTLSTSFSVLGYGFNLSYDIWGGGTIYPRP